MKYASIIFLLLTAALWQPVTAQEARELHETGRRFLGQGDFENAILVLGRACEKEPANITYAHDRVLAYHMKGDATKARELVQPLLEKEEADASVFLLASNIYLQDKDVKTAEKTCRKGLKKFEKSGALYNALGELQWMQQDYNAIKQWEKGIETDPSFPGNYYNACRYYYLTKPVNDKLWSLIYGEIFVNLESYSQRTLEIKNILIDDYKQLYQEKETLTAKKDGGFESALKDVLARQSGQVGFGISTETLLAVRTRFILSWFGTYDTKFPHKLFELHRQLLREGMFAAYNQWLFESITNMAAYENWMKTHAEEYAAFRRFQQNRVFKMPAGQYYHNVN
jgi:Tfp pilus assembly protein PilF